MSEKQEKHIWFNRTVRKLESPLLSYVFKIIFRHEASEETVQEGFLKLWAQEYPKFDDHYPKAWLYKVCRNMAIDYLRKESKLSLDDNLEEIISRPCISETLFDTSVVIQEISKLPKAVQEALILRFGNELSYKEIAVILKTTPSNVGVKIHEGLASIRETVLKELQDLN